MFLCPDQRRRLRRIAALLAVALLAGCDGGDKRFPPEADRPAPGPGAGSSPPPGAEGAIRIRGNERIAWTQVAASAFDLRSHSYRIYVDNEGAPLGGVQCSETTILDGYSCTAPLPALSIGPHVLALSSIRNGIESPRSAPLSVTRVASVETTQFPLTFEEITGAGTSAGDRVIEMSGAVSVMGILPDGRVLAVEDAQRVRVIENDRLVQEPVLSLDARRGSIVGLTVDSAFASTQTVYVAWTDRTALGSSELHITRYREFRNSLRDGATIVNGLPLVAEGPVPMAVDGDGLLYVAMPGRRSGDVDRNNALYSASILRFTRDGFVPPSNLRASPILAFGYTEPSGLAVDTHRRLWLSGRHGSWQHSVSSIPIDTATTQAWPAEPVGSPAVEHGTLALLRDEAAPLEWLIVATEDNVRRAEIGDDGRASKFDEVARLNLRGPVIAAASPAKSLYVAGTNDQRHAVIVRLSINRESIRQ